MEYIEDSRQRGKRNMQCKKLNFGLFLSDGYLYLNYVCPLLFLFFLYYKGKTIDFAKKTIIVTERPFTIF